MRTSEEIKKLILDVASRDERIRAVLLNGSRANIQISPDKYQDFDITYIVDDAESFLLDHRWTNVFGNKIIWQIPHEMGIAKDDYTRRSSFSILMLFDDGNRIDVTLLSLNKMKLSFKPDSLTIVWLDKDDLFTNISVANDSDYLITKPGQKEFLDTCNEFWWVCTYVAKGLWRNEILYAKEMVEIVVRPMFMNVIAWQIGIDTNFSVSIGKSGKLIKNYLQPELYDSILKTYSDHILENNWKALFLMTDIFGQLAQAVAKKLEFNYILTEEENVKTYLKNVYDDR